MLISKEKYIPGFDWFRIVGSIIVVAAHLGLFARFHENHNVVYKANEIVPVFFIISGYLAGSPSVPGRERERLKKQIFRYGIPYLVIEFSTVVIHFSKLVFTTGEDHFLGFMANVLRSIVMNNNLSGFTGQLWFIRALVYALFINAFLTPKNRKKVIISAIILRTILVLIGEEKIIGVFRVILDVSPLASRVFRADEFGSMVNQFLTGLLFTTIGFDIRSWKVKPLYMLLCGLVIGVFEIFVSYLGMASVFLSVALFFGIKSFPGYFLRPIHMEISLFSVLTFFLHMLEIKVFYMCGVESTIVSLFLIISVNLMFTLLLSKHIRKGRESALTATEEVRD